VKDAREHSQQEIDCITFESLTVEQQLKLLPQNQRFELKNDERVRSHPSCTVSKLPETYLGKHICSKIKDHNVCLGGDALKESWFCEKCTWMMCVKCMEAEKFYEMMTDPSIGVTMVDIKRGSYQRVAVRLDTLSVIRLIVTLTPQVFESSLEG